MKIALLGAPGSEKTKLAKALARALNKDHPKHWVVIDGYVNRLAYRTGREYGIAADYEHNLQIIGERWTLEAEALNKGHSTITCGTIYETIWYASLIALEPQPTESMTLAAYEAASGFMKVFAMLERGTFNYDAMFRLPWPEDVDESMQHTWDEVLNLKIPEILDGFVRHAVPLTGTHKQKVTYALEVIRAIQTAYTESAEDEQWAVRDGGEDDQGERVEEETVPDVQSPSSGSGPRRSSDARAFKLSSQRRVA